MANKHNLFMVEQLLPFFHNPCVCYSIPKDMKYPWIAVVIELRVSKSIYKMMLDTDNSTSKYIPFSYVTRNNNKGKAMYFLQGHEEINYNEFATIHQRIGHLMKHMMCYIRSHKIMELKNQINYISGENIAEIIMVQ